MLASLFAAVFTTALVAPPAANPCLEFDALYTRIRDQTIDRPSALARVRELLPQIRAFYYRMEDIMRTRIVVAALGALLLPTAAHAAEIKVLSTQAVEGAYRELVLQFEKASGHKVTTTFTGTLDAQKRIAAGEAYDLIIMAGPAIDELIKSGKVAPGSRVDLARSGVGVAVRAGAPRPDIHSTEALKKTLIAAKSIGYSSGPSGVYLTGLFRRLGIADQIKSKLKQTPTGVFVGSIIASGEVEIGFQQVSELAHYPGIDYVGPLPADIQHVTVFSSGMQIGAKSVDAAKAWITFLISPAAAAVFRSKSMEPAGVRRPT